MRRRNKKSNLVLLLLVILGSLGIGYAFLTQELTINGIGKINSNSWSVYFNNLVLNTNNVTLSTGDVEAVINPSTKTDISFTVTLHKPGDFYEFTVDVVNDGSIDAMIGLVSSKLNNVEIDQEHPLPAYLNYSVTYSDGFNIAEKHLLKSNTHETYKVRLEYNADISANDLPSTDQTYRFTFGIQYQQADNSAIEVVHPVSFEDDTWEVVVAAVKSGNTAKYHVGDTKTVDLGNGLGTHTLRIANMSVPNECNTEGFSQTACGFVLEFADIITNHVMNTNTTSVGGWPATDLYSYLNSKNDSTSLYNSLPNVLKNAIIRTDVISGYESGHTGGNYISSDRLYLLAEYELVGVAPVYGGDTLTSEYTRQLDYYADFEFSSNSNRNELVKNYNDVSSDWWLRTNFSNANVPFGSITPSGGDSLNSPTEVKGISPAFRLSGPASTYVDSCESFKEDSWEDIVSNAQDGNYSQYAVGCTKEVELGNSLGTHTLRVANISTPSVCSTEGFSQTACGFVLEFADNITERRMNPYVSEGTAIGANSKGGWEFSDMRAYLNSTTYAYENIDYSTTGIYSSLPSVIKDAIINTIVVSGHSSDDTTNFTTTDKLYLLSSHEVWEDVDENTNSGIDRYDTAYNNTRQLDYYANQGVTTSNYAGAIKQRNGSNNAWWLRAAYSSNTYNFFLVNADGSWYDFTAYNTNGVSPAFRLG